MLSVEGSYNIQGRGAVASGTVEQGKIKIGDDVEFYGYGVKMKSSIVGVETFNKTLDYGEAGDNVGILCRGVTREQLRRGLVMAKPGSLSTHTVLSANIYCLSTEEGGRKNSFSSGYRPQLYYKTADTAAELKLPDNIKIVKPGDNVTVDIKLHFPLTIVQGARFALREGGRTIASGVVTKILPEDYNFDTGKVKKGEKPDQTPKAAEPKK